MSGSRRPLVLLAPALSLSLLGVFATTVISINAGQGVEFGQGDLETDLCSSRPQIEFDSAFQDSDDELYISEVKLTNIPTICSGRQFELQFLGANNAVLETIFWEIDLIDDNSDTAIEAIANGSSTDASNASPSTASLIYPSRALNEPDPGLALNFVNVEDLVGFNLISR